MPRQEHIITSDTICLQKIVQSEAGAKKPAEYNLHFPLLSKAHPTRDKNNCLENGSTLHVTAMDLLLVVQP